MTIFPDRQAKFLVKTVALVSTVFLSWTVAHAQPRTYDAFYSFRIFDSSGYLITDADSNYKVLPLINKVEKQDSAKYYYKKDYFNYYLCFQLCDEKYRRENWKEFFVPKVIQSKNSVDTLEFGFFRLRIVHLKDTMEILIEGEVIFDSIPFSPGKYIITGEDLHNILTMKNKLKANNNKFIDWKQYRKKEVGKKED